MDKERDPERRETQGRREGRREGRPSAWAALCQAFPKGAPCPLSHSTNSKQPNPTLLFFLLEQKRSYISCRNFLSGAKDDPRRKILASTLSGLLAVRGGGGVGPWQLALAVPCLRPARFLARCPWPGQPRSGPGLMARFSCPVLVNSPWAGPDFIHVSALAGCCAGLLGPVFVLLQTLSSALTSSFWELVGFVSNLCQTLLLVLLGLLSQHGSGTACGTVS